MNLNTAMRAREFMNLIKIALEETKPSKKKAPTIASATMKNGEINRKIANRMVDPRGFFHPKLPK